VLATGGVATSYVTEDVSAFQQIVPASHVPFAIAPEAERMRRLKLFPATVEAAADVVAREVVGLRASADLPAMETLRGLAFGRHPYRFAAAGNASRVPQIAREVRAFYDRHFVPGNAVLVVVGDVRQEDVRASVDSHFGPLRREPSRPRVLAPVRVPPGPREQILDVVADETLVLAGYAVPDARHPDLPALRLCAVALGQGSESRLYQRLVVRDRIARAVGAEVRSLERHGLLEGRDRLAGTLEL
jgi:zinc protease